MPEAASSRSTLAVLLWGIAGALLSGAMAVLEPNMLEEGLILHLAQRMQDGEHLYRDLIAFTGPLPFELLSLLFGIFGQEIAVARVVVALLAGIACAGSFDLARRSEAGLLAHVAAGCVACIPVLMFPFFSIYFYTTLVFYLSLAAAAAAARGIESDGWALAAGALIAAAALCKQSVGALLAITMLAAIAGASQPGLRLRRVLATSAGGAAIAALTLGLYAIRGDLEPLVHSLIVLPLTLGETFNAPYMNFWPPGVFAPEIHVNKPLYLPFSYVIRNGVFSDVDWPMVLATQILYALPFVALIATAIRALRASLPGPVWVHTAALVALTSNLYPRTDWGHLVFVLAPSAVQLLLLVPARAVGATSTLRRAVAVLVLAPLVLGTGFEAIDLHRRSKPPKLGPRVPLRPVSDSLAGDGPARVVEYLARYAKPDEFIFVPRSEPLIYFATNTRNPTPYSGVLPGMPEEQQKTILEGLEQVRFVVMSEIDQPLYTYYRDELPDVQDYLERHFDLPDDFRGKHNDSWIVVLQRSEDRGPTLIDFFDEQDSGRRWVRTQKGKIAPAEVEAPVLGSRHNRRPLAFVLGPRGGGMDFDIDVPEGAVFEASVGFKWMVGLGARYAHQRSALMAVSVRSDDRFQRIGHVPVFFGRRLDYGWVPLRVDLSAFSGQRVTLRLQLIPEGAVDPKAIAWWGSPRITTRAVSEAADAKPGS
jgi:hypothetical protein